jgi:CHAT domain
MDYLDLEVDVSPGPSGGSEVHARSSSGEAAATFVAPWEGPVLGEAQRTIQRAILRSGPPSEGAATVGDDLARLGRELFDVLLPDGPVRAVFVAARSEADDRGLTLRIRLRADAPDVAALPWEYLSDPDRPGFLGANGVPLVREVAVGRPLETLQTPPPLRMLIVAVATEEASPDTERAKAAFEDALGHLVADGDILVDWLADPTWRALRARLLDDPWHIVHLIGRGGFDAARGEGFIVVRDESGGTTRLAATALGRLLGDQATLRLAVLTSNGADEAPMDFAPTATTLVGRGVPAVIAIPYRLDGAANGLFARTFYGAVARGLPLTSCIVDSRSALSGVRPGSRDWGAPALFTGSVDGVLVELRPSVATAAAGPSPVAAVPVEASTAPSQQTRAPGSTDDPLRVAAGAAIATSGPSDATRPDRPASTAAADGGLDEASGAIARAIRRGGYVSALIGAELGAVAALIAIPAMQAAELPTTVLGTLWPDEDTSALKDLMYDQGLSLGLWLAVVLGAWISMRLFRADNVRWTTFLLAIFSLVLVYVVFVPAFAESYYPGDTTTFDQVGVPVLLGVAAVVILARGITRFARTGGP